MGVLQIPQAAVTKNIAFDLLVEHLSGSAGCFELPRAFPGDTSVGSKTAHQWQQLEGVLDATVPQPTAWRMSWDH